MIDPMVRESALDRLAACATRLEASPPEARFILRLRPAAMAAAGAAFGLDLPVAACRAESVGVRAALWLGPDEWLLLAPQAEEEEIANELAVGLAGHPHALVAVSHRQTGVALLGRDVAEMLAIGCPLDLDRAAFPVGMCTRTLFAKAPIVLWRRAPEHFRVEVWRSFAPYLWQVLAGGLRERSAR